MDLKDLTIKKFQMGLRAGEFRAQEVTQAYLENIKLQNPKLNAYLSVFDDALEEAKKIDERLKRGEELPPLAGVPMAIKDVIMINGRQVRGASKILLGHIATYDATAVKRLRQQGAIFLGITNCDEFAMGASGENSAYGPTRNPLDNERVPGGSSSGSAAAVAGELALAALGSDTGGSIRQPAAFCGLVGLKPSYGAVSRYGLLALCSSFDQIGPLTRTVADAELIFKIIGGADPLDSTSQDFNLKSKVYNQKPVIGVPTDLPLDGCDKRVIDNWQDGVEKLRQLGYQTKEVGLPYLKYAIPVYYIILPAEASTNLARYDGLRYGAHVGGSNLLDDYLRTKGEGYGKEVRRRILLGTYVLSAGYYDAYYYRAARVGELIKQDFAEAFKKVDAIVLPTTAGPAFKLGEKSADPVKMYLEDVFTAPANIAGLCAISVPSGFAQEEGKRLPLGLQIMAAPGREATLFGIGKEFLGELE